MGEEGSWSEKQRATAGEGERRNRSQPSDLLLK